MLKFLCNYHFSHFENEIYNCLKNSVGSFSLKKMVKAPLLSLVPFCTAALFRFCILIGASTSRRRNQDSQLPITKVLGIFTKTLMV